MADMCLACSIRTNDPLAIMSHSSLVLQLNLACSCKYLVLFFFLFLFLFFLLPFFS